MLASGSETDSDSDDSVIIEPSSDLSSSHSGTSPVSGTSPGFPASTSAVQVAAPAPQRVTSAAVQQQALQSAAPLPTAGNPHAVTAVTAPTPASDSGSIPSVAEIVNAWRPARAKASANRAVVAGGPAAKSPSAAVGITPTSGAVDNAAAADDVDGGTGSGEADSGAKDFQLQNTHAGWQLVAKKKPPTGTVKGQPKKMKKMKELRKEAAIKESLDKQAANEAKHKKAQRLLRLENAKKAKAAFLARQKPEEREGVAASADGSQGNGPAVISSPSDFVGSQASNPIAISDSDSNEGEGEGEDEDEAATGRTPIIIDDDDGDGEAARAPIVIDGFSDVTDNHSSSDESVDLMASQDDDDGRNDDDDDRRESSGRRPTANGDGGADADSDADESGASGCDSDATQPYVSTHEDDDSPDEGTCDEGASSPGVTQVAQNTQGSRSARTWLPSPSQADSDTATPAREQTQTQTESQIWARAEGQAPAQPNFGEDSQQHMDVQAPAQTQTQTQTEAPSQERAGVVALHSAPAPESATPLGDSADSADSSGDLVQCPLCSEDFTPDTVQEHVETCAGPANTHCPGTRGGRGAGSFLPGHAFCM